MEAYTATRTVVCAEQFSLLGPTAYGVTNPHLRLVKNAASGVGHTKVGAGIAAACMQLGNRYCPGIRILTLSVSQKNLIASLVDIDKFTEIKQNRAQVGPCCGFKQIDLFGQVRG